MSFSPPIEELIAERRKELNELEREKADLLVDIEQLEHQRDEHNRNTYR